MGRRELGQYGENLAAEFLKRRGFEIVEKNFHTRWGEIDVVARRGRSIHFVEVKTRSGTAHGEPEEAINYFKQQRLLGAAKMYLQARGVDLPNYQIDAVSIIIGDENHEPIIRYCENIVLDH
jgi:putative endonuclease